jgi:hypothetical protein
LEHVAVKAVSVLCDMSEKAQEICFPDPLGEHGPNFYTEASHAFLSGVQPGENLDATNRVMIQELCALLEHSELPTGPSKSIKLYAWLRKTLSTATTNSIYGAMNPYRDPDIIDAYW